MGRIESYKQTEMGLIPEDWDVSDLNSLGEYPLPAIKAGPFGSSLKKDTYVKSGFKVYGQEQVIKGDINYGDYFVTQKKYRELESCSVRPGDVLLSLVGTLGKLLEIPSDAPKGIINPRLIRFSFSRSRIYPCFFRFLFESKKIQSLLANKAQGGTMGVLNAEILRNFKIVVPSKTEQILIGDVLSDVEELVKSLKKLIFKKRLLKKGVTQLLLTGKKRLPGFKDNWETKKFSEVFTFLPTASNSRDDLSENGDAYYIHYGDIHTKFHNHLDLNETNLPMIYETKCGNAALVKNGDWVMADVSEDSEGIGKTIEISGIDEGKKVIAGLHTFLLREKSPTFAPGFKGHLVDLKSLHDEYLRVATGMKVYGISKRTLADLEIPVPSIEEQIRITLILSDMNREISVLESKLSKALQLKEGMMQELLFGKIRLPSLKRSND